MGTRPCGCALKCFDKISEDQRKKLFAGFWESGDFKMRICVDALEWWRQKESTRRHWLPGGDIRKCTFVKNGAISEEVCKTAFLGIHGVSNGRLERAIKAQIKTGGTPHSDERGRHCPGNKTDEDDVAFIKSHIDSFPRYQSHYSRQDNPHRKYLSPELSVTKMYLLYKEKCREEKRETTCSEWVYRKTFNESFNLSFGM